MLLEKWVWPLAILSFKDVFKVKSSTVGIYSCWNKVIKFMSYFMSPIYFLQ